MELKYDKQTFPAMELIKTKSNNGYPGKSITEAVINGFFIVDRKWTVTYWNKAAETILKVREKDIVGKNLWQEFADVIPIDFYRVYQNAFRQDIPVHFREFWGEMGSWFDVITYYFNDTLSVSFKSSNQSTYPEHPSHPVQRLQIVNELYRFVTEVTNDCLWEWNFHTRELFWIDGGHKRIFGYDIENALIPQTFWENCVHPDDLVRVLGKLNRIIAEGVDSVWEDEYRFRKIDGDYAYVHDRGHIIYEKNNLPLRMIGATQDITARKLIEIRLLQSEKELVLASLSRQREITAAVLTAQEVERSDIGKELHDNLNQILAATKMYIQMAKKPGRNTGMYLEKSSAFISEVIEEIRKISKKLVVAGMHIIGLFDSIKILLDDLHMIHPAQIEFYEHDIAEKDMDERLQLDIFRIIQEQLNNVLKHAKATLTTIHLSRQADNVILLISDNGVGCNPLEKKGGVGIINIKSRADLYQGSVTIVTSPGAGYELKVVLPLNGRK